DAGASSKTCTARWFSLPPAPPTSSTDKRFTWMAASFRSSEVDMSESRPTALQLCPFSPYLEAGLRQRSEVVRWFALDAAAQSAWLEQHAKTVRAVVTGGHIGCANSLIEALPELGIIAINGVGIDKVDQNV